MSKKKSSKATAAAKAALANEVKKGQHVLRLRPGKEAAMYTPSADITHGLKGLLGSVIKLMYTEEYPQGDPRIVFAHDLANFTKVAELSDSLWEEQGVELLSEAFAKIDPQEATTFLYRFFLAVMDYYWHSVRLGPEEQCIHPEEMAKAADISAVLRTMPKELREEYLDHLKTYNMLPDIFRKGCLFDRVRRNVK